MGLSLTTRAQILSGDAPIFDNVAAASTAQPQERGPEDDRKADPVAAWTVGVVVLGLVALAAGLVFALRKHRVDRASTGNSVVVVDSSGQPRPLHSTIEQQLADYEVYAVPMESDRVLTTSARQSLATGTVVEQPGGVYLVPVANNPGYAGRGGCRVPVAINPVYSGAANQPSTTTGGTPLAAPAYRVLGEVQYGRSDFTAPSVPYDVLGTRTSAGNGGADDGYLVVASSGDGSDGSETTTYAVPQGSSPPGDAALHTVPAYRALGKAQHGRSDFTAPSVPYDVLGTRERRKRKCGRRPSRDCGDNK